MKSSDLMEYVTKLNSKKYKIDEAELKRVLSETIELLFDYEEQLDQKGFTIQELRSQIENPDQSMQYLKDTVVNAEQIAREIVEEAGGKATGIIADAQGQADEIRETAQKEAMTENAALLADTTKFRIQLSQMQYHAQYAQGLIRSLFLAKEKF